MSRNVGPTVDTLLTRVRQSGSIAVDEDYATQILTICQQILNIYLKRIVTSTTLTTLAEKLVYSIPSDLTTAVDVTDVTESSRSLRHCPSLKDFASYELNWFRNITATRFEAWCQVSRDLLIIYPGKAANSSVVVEHVKATTIYTDYSAAYNTALELPDEEIDYALRLAEAVLLLRARNQTLTKARLADLATALGIKSVSK
jgi:hypothetical protein